MESLLVDGLAAHRITRLIVTDQIGDRLRARVFQALTEGGYENAKDGLRCEWCTGVWVAVGITIARVLVPNAWRPIARIFAVADVVGIVGSAVAG